MGRPPRGSNQNLHTFEEEEEINLILGQNTIVNIHPEDISSSGEDIDITKNKNWRWIEKKLFYKSSYPLLADPNSEEVLSNCLPNEITLKVDLSIYQYTNDERMFYVAASCRGVLKFWKSSFL